MTDLYFNTTPVPITVFPKNCMPLTIPRSSMTLQLAEEHEQRCSHPITPTSEVAIPVSSVSYKKTWEDAALAAVLANHSDAKILVVSLLVGNYLRDHPDAVPAQIMRVFGPNTGEGAVRDDKGTIIGTTRFIEYFSRAHE